MCFLLGDSDVGVALESPPGFGVRTEAQKATSDHGFRIEKGLSGGWLCFASTTAPGHVWIGAASQHGPWYLSLDHAGVAAELYALKSADAHGPGVATFELNTITDVHVTINAVYRLSMSLPFAPLSRFEAQTRAMPKSTEAERLVVQRVGQDIFRDALLEYWNRQCPLTGITDEALLRASHIVAWADCDSDAHRLDVHNGLLLSALWDAAFDRGLVSFSDDGVVLASPALTVEARAALSFETAPALRGLRDPHRANLARHRAKYGFGKLATADRG